MRVLRQWPAATPLMASLFVIGLLIASSFNLKNSVFAATADAKAIETSVPLRLNERFLLQALQQAAFVETNSSATVWDDGSGCNYLSLREPTLEIVDGSIRLLARGNGRVGKSVSTRNCLDALNWDGYFESWQEPYIKAGGREIGFRVIKSQLLDNERRPRFRPSIVWHWGRRYVHPQIEKVGLPLTPVIENTRQLLSDFIAESDQVTLDAVIDTLKLERLRYDRSSIVVDLSFELEADAVVALEATKAPGEKSNALTEMDVNRLWQALDGFVTHTVRHAARSTETPRLRQQLLDVMLVTRHRLDLLLLASDRPYNSDFRQLFVDAWNSLTPILAEISDDLPSSSAINYLNFIAAGDVLTTIDAQGSRLGIELSVHGLRHLANNMPGSERDQDPIAWHAGVDNELRQLFGFGLPLPLPRSDVEDGNRPSPSGRLLDWFISPTYADALNPERLLIPRLNRWIVNVDNARSYVPLVDKLLTETIRKVLDDETIDKQFRDVYRPLVAATAWQESCFRQFINRDGRRTPLTSSAGAVGLMQIRPVVWRGFYDTRSLENDIGYNARAGAEILLQYFVRYAVGRDEHLKKGGLDNLAAATYAAYNGGPKRSTRYRDPDAPARARKVDNAFAEKFRKIRDGDRYGALACFGLK